ncbi:hypothetical protein NESM_000069100 [Novymonas esmeraldas]|uniref:Uncharacterized protein n=1 Tax=Novymonas esmeraldas TaxID=1808958 RepID=A0AAW0F2U0_9TRYP
MEASARLSADLDAIRQFVLEHQQHQLTGADQDGGDVTTRPVSHASNTVSDDATTTTDAARQTLHIELSALTEQLHVEKAASAQLRLQQRCDAASLRELLDQAAHTQAQVSALTAQVAEWTRRCRIAEAAHANCASHYESVQEQVRGVQRRVLETEAQQALLTATAADVQRLVARLADDKAQLQATLHAREAALRQMAAVELERDEARAQVDALNAQHDAWLDDVRAYKRFFDAAREEYARGVHHVAVARLEHETLREALRLSEARCRQWEALFSGPLRVGANTSGGAVSPQQSPPPPAAAAAALQLGPAQETTAVERDDDDDSDDDVCRTGTGGVTATPSSAAFVAHLEAKVVDLALRLRDAQDRADAAERTAAAVSCLSLADSALLIHLKALVCALRPQVEELAAHNAQLQTRLLASESFVEAAVQHAVRLGEALADEASKRCWLVAASARGGSVNDSGARAGAGEAQQQQQPAAASSRNTLAQGRRHRLRSTALEWHH